MDTEPTHREAKQALCHVASHKHPIAVGFLADDGREHWLGLAQFLEAMLESNQGAEPGACPERLHIRFATADIVVVGRRLRRLAELLQRGELERVHPLAERYAGLAHAGPDVRSLTVTPRAEP